MTNSPPLFMNVAKKLIPYSLGAFLFLALLGFSGCGLRSMDQNAPSPSSTSAQAPHDLFLGFPKKTFTSPDLGFSFDYPEKAVVEPHGKPVPLSIVEKRGIIYLTADSIPEAPSGLFFAARKVNTPTEMEKFYQEVAQDKDCKGIELFDNEIRPGFSKVDIENIDMTDPKKCDHLINGLAIWNKQTHLMMIMPGKGNAPDLIYEPLEGDYEIFKTLRFADDSTQSSSTTFTWKDVSFTYPSSWTLQDAPLPSDGEYPPERWEIKDGSEVIGSLTCPSQGLAAPRERTYTNAKTLIKNGKMYRTEVAIMQPMSGNSRTQDPWISFVEFFEDPQTDENFQNGCIVSLQTPSAPSAALKQTLQNIFASIQ